MMFYFPYIITKETTLDMVKYYFQKYSLPIYLCI